MATTLGIVEVRSSAPQFIRSPAALAGRRLGGKSLLEWLVQRVTEAQQLDHVIALVDEPHAESLLRFIPPNVPVFRSRQADSLASLVAAAEAFACDAIVRVRLGNPFVDPVLIDRLVVAAQGNAADDDFAYDYASYCSNAGRSAVRSRLGMVAEWCRVESLQQADRDAVARDRHDGLRHIYSHPERFQLRLLPLPAQLDHEDLRLVVRCEEDWDHVEAVFEALGPEGLEWQRIARLLDQQPVIRQQMAKLNRGDAALVS